MASNIWQALAGGDAGEAMQALEAALRDAAATDKAAALAAAANDKVG